MRTVVVNGSRNIEVPVELQTPLAEILNDNTTNLYVKHKLICDLLSIGRYAPAPTHKPYALRCCQLNIYDLLRCVSTLGGWYECWRCSVNIDNKPQGQNCMNCGASTIPNFKVIVPEKKPRRS